MSLDIRAACHDAYEYRLGDDIRSRIAAPSVERTLAAMHLDTLADCASDDDQQDRRDCAQHNGILDQSLCERDKPAYPTRWFRAWSHQFRAVMQCPVHFHPGQRRPRLVRLNPDVWWCASTQQSIHCCYPIWSLRVVFLFFLLLFPCLATLCDANHARPCVSSRRSLGHAFCFVLSNVRLYASTLQRFLSSQPRNQTLFLFF